MKGQPIRLSCDEGEALRRLSTFVGRHCDFFVDGEELDRLLVFAADECEGTALLLTRKDTGGKFWSYEFDPIARRPVLEKRLGRVEIRLHATAPPAARNAYRALRRGDWMHALSVVDAYDKKERDAEQEEVRAWRRDQERAEETP